MLEDSFSVESDPSEEGLGPNDDDLVDDRDIISVDGDEEEPREQIVEDGDSCGRSSFSSDEFNPDLDSLDDEEDNGMLSMTTGYFPRVESAESIETVASSVMMSIVERVMVNLFGFDLAWTDPTTLAIAEFNPDEEDEKLDIPEFNPEESIFEADDENPDDDDVALSGDDETRKQALIAEITGILEDIVHTVACNMTDIQLGRSYSTRSEDLKTLGEEDTPESQGVDSEIARESWSGATSSSAQVDDCEESPAVSAPSAGNLTKSEKRNGKKKKKKRPKQRRHQAIVNEMASTSIKVAAHVAPSLSTTLPPIITTSSDQKSDSVKGDESGGSSESTNASATSQADAASSQADTASSSSSSNSTAVPTEQLASKSLGSGIASPRTVASTAADVSFRIGGSELFDVTSAQKTPEDIHAAALIEVQLRGLTRAQLVADAVACGIHVPPDIDTLSIEVLRRYVSLGKALLSRQQLEAAAAMLARDVSSGTGSAICDEDEAELDEDLAFKSLPLPGSSVVGPGGVSNRQSTTSMLSMLSVDGDDSDALSRGSTPDRHRRRSRNGSTRLISGDDEDIDAVIANEGESTERNHVREYRSSEYSKVEAVSSLKQYASDSIIVNTNIYSNTNSSNHHRHGTETHAPSVDSASKDREAVDSASKDCDPDFLSSNSEEHSATSSISAPDILRAVMRRPAWLGGPNNGNEVEDSESNPIQSSAIDQESKNGAMLLRVASERTMQAKDAIQSKAEQLFGIIPRPMTWPRFVQHLDAVDSGVVSDDVSEDIPSAQAEISQQSTASAGDDEDADAWDSDDELMLRIKDRAKGLGIFSNLFLT